MPTLRSKVIRLAHENTNLRPHLLPILMERKTAAPAMPTEVKKFVDAVEANAKEAEMSLSRLVHTKMKDDGSWQMSDNYERFWSLIYTYRDGEWFVRDMHSERSEKPYTFAKAMSDASMMYTG